MPKFLLKVSTLLLWCNVAHATTYWVDSSVGSDTNSGLTQSASGTTGPFLTINHAAGVVSPGDTVNICPGKGYGGGTGGSDPVSLTTSGTAGNPITFQGCPGQPMPIISGTQSFAAVALVLPVSYITIQGLEVAGWNAALTPTGIWANQSLSSATCGNNNVYNGNGIASEGADAFTFTTNATTAIGNSTLHFASSPTNFASGYALYNVTHPTAIPAGAVITGAPGTSTTSSIAIASPGVSNGDTIQAIPVSRNIQILNNYVHDFPLDGVTPYNSDYVTVDGNLVTNSGWYGCGGGSGISLSASRDVDASTGYKNFITRNVVVGNSNLTGNFHQVAIPMTAAAGSSGSTINLTTNPSSAGVVATAFVVDRTTPSAIAAFSRVVSMSSTSVTISPAIAGTVATSDAIAFAQATDGEGIIVDTNNNTGSTQPYAGRTLVSSNLVIANGMGGIQAGPHSSHIDMVFNTAYQNQTEPQPGSAYYEGEMSAFTTTDVNVFENILVPSILGAQGFSSPTATTTWSYNLANGGNGNSFPTGGTGNLVGDPLFVSPSTTMPQRYLPYAINDMPPLTQFFVGFQLQPGSPAIDAANLTGLAGGAARTTDILGNPGEVGPSYDIGAFETPCSPFGANSIQSMTTLLAAQGAGAINGRNLAVSLSCGRSPYAH